MRRRPIPGLLTLLAAPLALAVLGGLAGCENDGPLEEAGEEVDEGLEDLGDELEDIGDDIDGGG